MIDTASSELIPCRVCQGDARASRACKECLGAGIGLSSPDGFLVWSAPLDRFTFSFRRARARVNTVFHTLLGGLMIGCLAGAAYGFAIQEAWQQADRFSFWVSGYWFVTLLWAAALIACFFFFRLRQDRGTALLLPNWGKTRRAIVARTTQRTSQAFDVSPYFDAAAWSVLEQAFDFSEKIGRAEVTAATVFVSSLFSPAGGVFLSRLGMDLEKVRERLVPFLQSIQPGSPTAYTPEAKAVLLHAYQLAHETGCKQVGVMELFIEAFHADPRLQEMMDAAGYPAEHIRHAAEWVRIQRRLKEEHDRFVALAAFKPKTEMNRIMSARATPLLHALSEDLTILARDGYIAPVMYRKQETEALLRAMESGKNAVVLVGEAGVGKTSIVEDLARRMVEEDVPKILFDKRLVSINLVELVAGHGPSEASQRLLDLLNEVAASGNIVLVLEGIDALVGAGVPGTMDLAEAFATEVSRLNILVIGTATPEAWGAFLERRSIGSLMVRVDVPEMKIDEAVSVLMAKVGHVEYQNKVFFTYAALAKAVELAARFLRDRHLPESAIGIAQEAAVLTRKEQGEHAFVTAEDVAKIIHAKTRVPVESVTQSESQKLLDLEKNLHRRVIGQDEAVIAVAQAMRRARADVREGKRPIANFLFLGPTGVGKTELSKALAAEYFGDENAMIRLDMSEFQHPSSVARVIGHPGDDRGGWLTEQVRQHPFAIVLLDELEKAHPDILTLFLQVMDDGRLTDGMGRTVNFTNVVLIATSNAGTSFIQEAVTQGIPLEQIRTALLERELKGVFRPEFLNRFDAVIVFQPLALDHVTQIAWLMINRIAAHLEKTKGILFRAEDAAVEELAQAGFDPLFGARPLRRVIQDRVENGLADLILRQSVKRRDTVLLLPGGKMEVQSRAT